MFVGPVSIFGVNILKYSLIKKKIFLDIALNARYLIHMCIAIYLLLAI